MRTYLPSNWGTKSPVSFCGTAFSAALQEDMPEHSQIAAAMSAFDPKQTSTFEIMLRTRWAIWW
jgi:hypothetical protein